MITTFGIFFVLWEEVHTRSAKVTGFSESIDALSVMCGLMEPRAERRAVNTATERQFARAAWLIVRVMMRPQGEYLVRTRSLFGDGGFGERWVWSWDKRWEDMIGSGGIRTPHF